MRLNTILSYIRSVAENSLRGAPYFTSMEMISAWLEVLKALNRSSNTTHFGILWLCIRFRSFFIVSVLY